MVTVGVATAAVGIGRVLLEMELEPPLLVDPPLFCYPGMVGLVVAGVEPPELEAGGTELVELEMSVLPPVDVVSPPMPGAGF